MPPISFNQIPSGNRVPFTFIEFASRFASLMIVAASFFASGFGGLNSVTRIEPPLPPLRLAAGAAVVGGFRLFRTIFFFDIVFNPQKFVEAKKARKNGALTRLQFLLDLTEKLESLVDRLPVHRLLSSDRRDGVMKRLFELSYRERLLCALRAILENRRREYLARPPEIRDGFSLMNRQRVTVKELSNVGRFHVSTVVSFSNKSRLLATCCKALSNASPTSILPGNFIEKQ